jgi:phage baseplate assembly protein W|tara:strand:+ start:1770 stop:2225 length:456 start_codon:yes stop_codon:yes gene_type:complete
MAAARTRNSFTVSDAENKNNSSLNSRVYSDLDLFFTKRSVDKDVNTLTNVQAIKRSVRNLVLTNFYEKPFHPEIGSGVRELLFEIASPLTSLAISQAVTDVINNYEPRASLNFVDVNAQLDNNAYDISINFSIVNGPPESVDLALTMELIR